MKWSFTNRIAAASLFLTVGLAPVALADNDPVGTSFTYQGRLMKAGQPAAETVNLTFRLFATEVGGQPIATANAPGFSAFDSDGNFTIDIDFGEGAFTGGERWLEVQIDDTILSPRQPVMAAPHAMVAGTAVNVPTKAMAGNYPGITGVGTLESLRVSGDVAIGTNQARQQLSVGNFLDLYSGLPSGNLTQPSIRGSSGGALSLNAHGNNGVLFLNRDGGGGGMRFHNGSDGLANELMRLTPQGRLGIGTTSPTHLVTIQSSDGPSALRLIGPTGSFQWGARLNFGDGNFAYIEEDENDKFRIHARLGTRFTGGNIGILTMDPRQHLSIGSNLDLYSGSANDPTRPSIRGSNVDNLVLNASGAGATFINHDDGTGGVRFHNGTGGSSGEVARMTGDGLWGLGTSNPNSRLHVNAPTNITPLRVQRAGSTRLMVHENGRVAVGSFNEPQDTLHVFGTTRTNVLRIMGGSDLAERFDVAPRDEVSPRPGMVVCIDPDNPGKLVTSTRAYDRTVAGIISGANGINSGMIMGQEGSEADGAYPVALTGRVYVLADATEAGSAIEPGDLLTTSSVPGHAMKVQDYVRGQGAIIGKAMTRLAEGERGMVLVLVSLQ